MPRSVLRSDGTPKLGGRQAEPAADSSRFLDRSALATIYGHAAADYPAECCGFVSAGGVHPCANVQDHLHQMDPQLHPRTSRSAFALSFESTMFLLDSLSGDDPVRVIYHSHPDVGAYFSEEDRRFASKGQDPVFPSVDYLVVDVRRGSVRGARLFSLLDGTFREIRRYSALP